MVIQRVADTETAEVLTCRKGRKDYHLQANLYIKKFRLASHCAGVVKCLQGTGMGIARPSVISWHAKEILKLLTFVHENRRFIVKLVGMCAF